MTKYNKVKKGYNPDDVVSSESESEYVTDSSESEYKPPKSKKKQQLKNNKKSKDSTKTKQKQTLSKKFLSEQFPSKHAKKVAKQEKKLKEFKKTKNLRSSNKKKRREEEEEEEEESEYVEEDDEESEYDSNYEEDEDSDDEDEEDDSDDEDEDEKSESKKKNEEVELSFGDLDVTSDVNEMFGDNEFSDEFKEKAGVIYESAVKSTIRAHAEKIEEGMEAKIEESVRTGLDEITSNLNNYLDYIAEEWMVENKLAVESGIKTEITEDFIKGLRTVFENAYVDIPDEARDLVAEQTARIDELEIQLDEELNRKISMKTELHEANKKAVFDQVCEDLTYTEKAKMTTLAEDLDYETNEDYLNKLNILKENYFKTDVQEDSSEAPVEATTASPDVSDSMSSYISAIAQMTDK